MRDPENNMEDWYNSHKVMHINAPAFVLSEQACRLRDVQSLVDPTITSWQGILKLYRKQSDDLLIELRDSNNPNFRDAASQVLLEREYNRVLEEEKLLNLRKRMVLEGLAQTNNNELMQSLSHGWLNT